MIFDMREYDGPIQFLFSIISGRLLTQNFEGKKTLIREISPDKRALLLASQKRALGHESGNADKLLQYMLFKYTGSEELPENRRLFVAGDSKIKRDP